MSKIVEAVGIAVHATDPNRGKRIEEVMTQAVKDAQAKGITDPDKIRRLILQARDKVV
jgi:hypothetical protein